MRCGPGEWHVDHLAGLAANEATFVPPHETQCRHFTRRSVSLSTRLTPLPPAMQAPIDGMFRRHEPS